MQLHFYTRFEKAELLEEGMMIPVWTKNVMTETDIQISLNLKDYVIEKVNDHIYNVSKIF